jgi:hypothetical protein
MKVEVEAGVYDGISATRIGLNYNLWLMYVVPVKMKER